MAGSKHAGKRGHGAKSGSKGQNAKPPPPRPARAATYVSDGSDSEDDGPVTRGPIPLQSLEQGRVRDFVAEFEHEHAQPTSKRKASKRARQELAQLEVDKAKRRFREDRAEKVVWRKFDRANRVFEAYYRRALGLVGEEHDDEWTRLVAALEQPVAVHLRVNGHYRSLCEIVTGTLELDFPLADVVVPTDKSEGEAASAATAVTLAPVPWLSDKSLWKLSLDPKTFRKAERLADLRQYVQTQGHLGTLLRTDPLTAVLPSFLGPVPGDRVLDLCGGGELRAPMIAELLEADESKPSALVVNARDAALAARAVQSLGRTLARSRAVAVTAHKPLEFPLPEDVTSGGFDRVLCAPPCSGDGLIRKLPETWRTWSPAAGQRMHPQQLALATRALALVRPGGHLLYSTRSLNPIENEAVVAELIRVGAGAYELVNVSEVCPGLVRRPGLATWDVVAADDVTNTIPSWEAATPEQQRQGLRASMWPPVTDTAMHLERCVRILPHLNDTHGLFLALLRKIREPMAVMVPAGPEPLAPSVPLTKGGKSKKKLKHEQPQGKHKKLLGSLSVLESKPLARLRAFYGIADSALTHQEVLARSGFAKDAAVHVVTAALTDVIVEAYKGRLIVHRAGVEAFKLVASSGAFELVDDGARALLPVLRRQVLQLPMDEFSRLLATKEMWLKDAGDVAKEMLAESAEGSLVVVLDDMEPVQTADQDLVLVAIKRHSSYSLVSSPAAIARVKALMKELEADEDDGYDSFEFEDDD